MNSHKLTSITETFDKNFKEVSVTCNRIATLIRSNSKKYIVTTSHNLCDTSVMYINGNEITNNIHKKYFIPEIDLLIIETNYDNENFINLEDCIPESYNIFSLDLNYIDESKNVYDTKLVSINKSKYNNICFPEFLKLTFEKNDEDIYGCSGSPVFHQNFIFGVISGFNSSLIHVIPFVFIERIIIEISSFGQFSGLCGFFYKTKVRSRSLIISSNIMTHNYYGNLDNLKINDEVIEIDEIKVNGKYLHSDKLDLNIDIETYVNITKNINDVISFKILRDGSINLIRLNCRDINSSRIHDFKSSNYEFIVPEDDSQKCFMPVNYKTFEFISKFRNLNEDKKLISIFKNKISKSKIDKFICITDLSKENTNILTTKFLEYYVMNI